ncbi:Sec-independent protein translocase subunit TatA [Spirillospora sp. NPDC052269]
MPGGFSVSHWLVVIVAAMLLFGAKRMPDAARSLGRSLRILKSEVDGLAGADGAEPPEAASEIRHATTSHEHRSSAGGRAVRG